MARKKKKKYPHRVKISVDFQRIVTITSAEDEDDIIEDESEKLAEEVAEEVENGNIAYLCITDDYPTKKKRKKPFVSAYDVKETKLSIRSATGKTIPITAICLGHVAANRYMAAHLDESLIGVQGQLCFIAKTHQS